jgi:TIR domain-containing protein
VSNVGEPPIRVFLSYAQADDEMLGFINPFTTSLRHMALADQGRNLDIFIDRESVNWGENWQAAIQTGIDGAMIFMPVVTRQYFDRAACREELLTFYNEAKSLGVTSLLLPVVLLGHSYISENSEDIAVRIISERQYRDLKEAWVAGPQSVAWRSAIVQLAAELVGAATAAEHVLAAALPASGPSSRPVSAFDDAPGANEVSEALELFGEESPRLVKSLTDILLQLTGVISSAGQFEEKPPGEVRQALLELASQLQPIGVDFQEAGRELESVTMKTDEVMRGYIRYLRENQMYDILESERASLEGAEEAFQPIAQIEGFVADFLDQIRPLEVSSAPMRHSMRGFREGGSAVRGAIAIMGTWPKVLDEK